MKLMLLPLLFILATLGLIRTLGDDVIASGTQSLGGGSVLAGTCVRQFSSAPGALPGQVVAWTYGNSLSISDVKLIVYPQVYPDSITWNVCNETAGTLFRSGVATVNWRLLP